MGREKDIALGLRAGKEDPRAMDTLIRDHLPFIREAAYRSTGTWIREEEDLWSVALMAFHEAVLHFQEGRGAFYPYARLVIRSRCLDYLRKEGRRREVPADPGLFQGQREESPLALEIWKALQKPREEALGDEIRALGEELAACGLDFLQRAEASPKAAKTREACRRIIRFLLESGWEPGQEGRLPQKLVLEAGLAGEKLLERHRRYLLGGYLIAAGDYPLLQDYLFGK